MFFACWERESLRKTRETKLPLWELSWLINNYNDGEKNCLSAGCYLRTTVRVSLSLSFVILDISDSDFFGVQGCYLRRGSRVLVIGRGVAPRVTTTAPPNQSSSSSWCWWWSRWWWWWSCHDDDVMQLHQRNTCHCSKSRPPSPCLTWLDPDRWSEADVVSPSCHRIVPYICENCDCDDRPILFLDRAKKMYEWVHSSKNQYKIIDRRWSLVACTCFIVFVATPLTALSSSDLFPFT